jgi:hypothetical protein
MSDGAATGPEEQRFTYQGNGSILSSYYLRNSPYAERLQIWRADALGNVYMDSSGTQPDHPWKKRWTYNLAGQLIRKAAYNPGSGVTAAFPDSIGQTFDASGNLDKRQVIRMQNQAFVMDHYNRFYKAGVAREDAHTSAPKATWRSMNGLSATVDLSPLKAAAPIQICFGQHQVQLHLDSGDQVVIEGECELVENGVTVRVVQFGEHAAAFCRLIGSRVERPSRLPDGGLSLEFENGRLLRIPNDSREFECVQIRLGGRLHVG